MGLAEWREERRAERAKWKAAEHADNAQRLRDTFKNQTGVLPQFTISTKMATEFAHEYGDFVDELNRRGQCGPFVDPTEPADSSLCRLAKDHIGADVNLHGFRAQYLQPRTEFTGGMGL